MKVRYIVLFFMFIGLLLFTPARTYGDGSDFREARIVGGGLSLNYTYGYVGSRSLRVPPVVAYVEIGVHERITVGPFFGYSRWSYPARTHSFVNVGGRASFHLSPFLNEVLDANIDVNEFDIYAAMFSGLELRIHGPSAEDNSGSYIDNTRLFLGPVAGLRYNFSDNIGVFSEMGRGALGALTIGISLHL
ncbi:MAG: hypothetical protein R6U62_08740 [Bacteroidales bacterium]